MEPVWLKWAKELAAISQNGLTFAENAYDVERYQAVRRIAAEMMAARSDLDTKTLLTLLAKEEGYATPKVDVRGVVFRDDKILLVKERIDGGWTLPGGWADPCQSPSECVVREIREESGYEAVARRLLAVYDRSKHPHEPLLPFHIYKLFFLCEITGGSPQISHETTAVDFFAEDQIPDLSISRTLPFQIARMFEHRRNPDLPTDFD
ncbi:MAG: ADP-ribose pyrophosphatase [Planctomycetes bacterium RBG_16_55_9]|nr:MAG: ADP-ribose pyrophosphatase [Planctomycetes bacterium RBG_16_55_9]